MFGWVDFREDGKHREEKWVENSVFHYLAKGEKYWGWKTREKIFSPGPTNLILPNREKNYGEKSALTAKLRKCPLFPNGHSNSAKKKKTIFQPPTQTIHHHHCNPKITQNQHKKQLKINSNPIIKPIPNPTQNQPKTNSTQNQPIFIFIIIIFSLPCSFRTVKKKKKRDAETWGMIFMCERELQLKCC